MSHSAELFGLLPQHAVHIFRIASANKRILELSLAGISPVSGLRPVEDSDRDLITRIQAGDEKAFGLLYDRHSQMAYSIALRILKSPAAAEDVLQDIFLQIWRRPPQIPEVDFNLRGWICVVTRNRSLAALRIQASHRSISIDNIDLASSLDLEAEALRHELYAKAEQLANILSPEEQRLLKMRFDQGMTHSTIATLTAIPLGTVKTRFRHALRRLRKTLEATR